MSNELNIDLYPRANLDVRVNLIKTGGIIQGSDILLEESNSLPGVYFGSIPTDTPTGLYHVRFFDHDTSNIVGFGSIYWDFDKQKEITIDEYYKPVIK